MKLLLVAALLAATCQRQPSPAPSPDPGTVIGEVEDAGTPEPSAPEVQCETAYAVMADAECAPANGHDGWMADCAKVSAEALGCVMSAESCAAARACLEKP